MPCPARTKSRYGASGASASVIAAPRKGETPRPVRRSPYLRRKCLSSRRARKCGKWWTGKSNTSLSHVDLYDSFLNRKLDQSSAGMDIELFRDIGLVRNDSLDAYAQ